MKLKFADMRRIFILGFCLGMALAVIEKARPWQSMEYGRADIPTLMQLDELPVALAVPFFRAIR